MPFIAPGGSATFVLPAGQSGRVGAPRTTAIIYTSNQPAATPETFSEFGRATNGLSATIGPFGADRTLKVEAGPTGSVEYIIGSVNVTDTNYAPNAVAITGGTISATAVGNPARSTVFGTRLAVTSTDNSGTPGNVTNNSGAGRAAIAAGANSCVVTNSLVAAAGIVLIQPRALDATATQFSVVTAAGSFTVTANANATANLPFDFLLIQP